MLFEIPAAMSDLLRRVAHDVALCSSVKTGNFSEEVSTSIFKVDHGY